MTTSIPSQNPGLMIIGATSAIATGVAREALSRGTTLFLIARDPTKLGALAHDLKVRFPTAQLRTQALNYTDDAGVQTVAKLYETEFGQFPHLLIAYGELGDQRASELQWAETRRLLEVNFISCFHLLHRLANYFENRSLGGMPFRPVLAVISSVAGDRGRQSNYTYGVAKGALTLLLAGLRNRLFSKGVSVLTIKPGFVDTPMTAAFKKGPLWAKPDAVGRAIFAAIQKSSRNQTDILYVPGIWRWIMLVIQAVPERIFKKLKL